MNEPINKLTVSVAEAAQMLGVSLPTMYDITKISGFPAFKKGRRILIPVKAFEAWVNNAPNA